MFKNIIETKQYIEKNQVKYVDLKLTDLRGRFRHITIPAERLNESVMKDGIGFDASNYGYASVEKSDMVFYPDLSSARPDPFAEETTLTMFGDVRLIREKENVPFNQYPRNILTRAVEFMKEENIADEMIIGPEYEFSVFDSVACRIAPDEVSYRLFSEESEWSGNDEYSNGYHTLSKDGYHADRPNDIHFDLRNQICSCLKDYGIPVKSAEADRWRLKWNWEMC